MAKAPQSKKRPLKMHIDHDPGTQLEALLRKLDEVRDAIVELSNQIADWREDWHDAQKPAAENRK